jgi:beta-lactam-binding protein with PASTA domain
MAIVAVVIALAIGGAVWAITSSSNGNQATPPPTTKPQGSASTTTGAPPRAPSTTSTTSTVVTPSPADTVRVPDVVTGTVVSSAEQMLQGARLQYMLQTQPVSACTLPTGAYNQNAVVWQTPPAGSVAMVGSQVILGVC